MDFLKKRKKSIYVVNCERGYNRCAIIKLKPFEGKVNEKNWFSRGRVHLQSRGTGSRETIEAAIKASSQKDRWDGMEKQLNGGKRLAGIFRGGTLQRDRVQCRLGLIQMNQHALTYFKNGPSLSDLM